MSPPAAVEPLLRELAPSVLGALLRRHRDFAAAEDAVQEAVVAALRQWPTDLPDNPGGWLYHAARRRLADGLERDAARRARETAVAAERPDAAAPATVDDDEFAADGDDTLLLLFTCCHPALTAPSAIALVLRAVAGLTAAEIARAFLVPEATMAQRLSRARQSIAESGVPLRRPDSADRAARLPVVLHVIYLIFNEGHTASAGPELQRVELQDEAIRLLRLLHRLLPDDAEVQGLLALMLLTHARRAARAGPDGALIPLDEQDRARWDRAAIAEGTALCEAAFRRGRVGSYQLQAAIAALHSEAPSTAATDWPQILALYEVLRRIAHNPMVELGHAVAAAMVHGPGRGLELLQRLEGDRGLLRSHRLDAVRAHFCEMAGRRDEAAAHYRAAALGATSLPERQYLLGKAARLQAP